MYTIKISDVNKNDIAEVGGKAANLGELINAGFPVPEGFCITACAYEYYVKYNCGDGTVTEEQLGKGKMPYDLLCEILTCYRRLDGGERVAVRSSATLEDLKEVSFVGQQGFYLPQTLFPATRRIY